MLVALFTVVASRLTVTSPSWFVSEFKDSAVPGEIMESTAAFGAPYYGEHFFGSLKYAKPTDLESPHCTHAGYADVDAFEASMKPSDKETHERRDPYVVVVRRGGCTFVTKVLAAQEMGASAVIIIDHEDSPYTSMTIFTIIMADDRQHYGNKISIPSVLISKEDGRALLNGIERAQANKEKPVVKMHWDVPANDIAVMDLWLPVHSQEANLFVQEFADVAESLLYNMQFIPHYALERGHSHFHGECWDDDAWFCAEDPDMSGPITGKEMVEETLRQLCLWHSHLETDPSGEKITISIPGKHGPSSGQVSRARKWWEYVSVIQDQCPLNAVENDMRFGSQLCSERVMHEIGADVAKVHECIKVQGRQLLEIQFNDMAWDSLAIRINDWMFRGKVERVVVAKSICSSFTKSPEACIAWKKNDWEPLHPFLGRGINWYQCVLIVVSLICLLGLMLYAATRVFIFAYTKKVLQEEVTIQVSQQMAEYAYLEGDSEDEAAISKRPGLFGKVARKFTAKSLPV